MTQRELEQEIQKAFDGELSEAGAEALREVLRNSPSALDIYCDQALLESELRRHAAGRCRVPGTIPYRARLAETLRQRRLVWVAGLSAAAVLTLAGVVLHSVWLSPKASLARLEISSGSRLCYADGSEFQGDGLQRDQPVVLGQGVVRFTFESGVAAVVEGPATINLAAPDRMELAGGHAWVLVPPQARGFRVGSAQFEVVDRGTEFGLDLREDVTPQVHVLQGEVEVAALIGNRNQTRLKAGAAGMLTPNGRWEIGRAEFKKFRTRLPESLPAVKLEFETMLDGRLEVEGNALGLTGATARVMAPELARLVPGVTGKALQLNGDGAYVETTWPGISGSAPRTVAVWCRVPAGTSFATAPALALWGNPALGFSRKFKVALCTTSHGTTLRTSFGNTLIDGITPLADSRWHHLAVVYRGNRADGSPDVAMFIDGRAEPSAISKVTSDRIETDTGSGSGMPLEFGRYELGSYGRNPFLIATLDQFRVIAGALAEAEIRALAAPPENQQEIR